MRCSDPKPPERPIIGFMPGESGEWIALLACGHRQHMRHKPPLMNRPWLATEEGRNAHVGDVLRCAHCLEEKALPYC